MWCFCGAMQNHEIPASFPTKTPVRDVMCQLSSPLDRRSYNTRTVLVGSQITTNSAFFSSSNKMLMGNTHLGESEIPILLFESRPSPFPLDQRNTEFRYIQKETVRYIQKETGTPNLWFRLAETRNPVSLEQIQENNH